jgi:hypothetical protein
VIARENRRSSTLPNYFPAQYSPIDTSNDIKDRRHRCARDQKVVDKVLLGALDKCSIAKQSRHEVEGEC